MKPRVGQGVIQDCDLYQVANQIMPRVTNVCPARQVYKTCDLAYPISQSSRLLFQARRVFGFCAELGFRFVYLFICIATDTCS